MNNFIVVYDACVLYPAPLRDLLMQLALTDLFQAKWTDTIHDEWMQSVLNNRRDLTIPQLQRTRELMNMNVRDCMVKGYEKLIPSLSLPDPDDRHVLAAAIRASASTIITYNLKDYPKTITSKYYVVAQHPDEFLTQLLELAPDIVCSAIRKVRQRLRNPPKTVDEYLDILSRQALDKTVKKLKLYKGQI